MRLPLVAIPAALVTLALFLFIEALVRSPERLPEDPGGRGGVALVAAPGRVSGGRASDPTGDALPAPPALAPVPRDPAPAPPAVAAPALPRQPPEVRTAVPELPLELGGFVLPPAPEPPPPPRHEPEPVAAAPSADPAQRHAAQVDPPAQGARVAAQPRVPEATRTEAAPGSASPDPPDTAAEGAVGKGGSGHGEVVSGGAAQGRAETAMPVHRVEPRYPRRAARAGREGWVKLAFTITSSGRVTDVKVVDAQPPRLFDQSARQALSQWRFRPQVVNGQPVPREAVQVIEFRLARRG